MDENATVSVCKKMTLGIKEMRGTYSGSDFKKGFTEVSSNTRSYFHWVLCGITSKFGPEIIESKEFDHRRQEIYHVVLKSDGYDIGVFGFKQREEAIRNALEFAERNGIEVDGYELQKE